MGIYEDLGVSKIINGYDTMTYLGGSVMPEEVVFAMQEASKHFVDINELHEQVGKELALLTHNEAALVCGGAAAGLALATAACIAGDDPALVERLPDTTGLRDEVIVHRCQRNPYDQAIRQVGANLVEIGYFDTTSPEQLRGAITSNTAAVFYFCGTTFEQGALPLNRVIEIAESFRIPVIVDAAAQLPPLENLWLYTKMGAKLAIFSGGKGLRGPQGSGLIVGDRDYVHKCAVHSCPNHGIGRAMKVSKEDIVGLYVAVKRFVFKDHEKELQQREEMVGIVLEAVKGISGIKGWRKFPARLGQKYPRAIITLADSFPVERKEVLNRLKTGHPRIELGSYESDERSIYVNPLTLSISEAQIIADRLRDVLLQIVNDLEK
jgi:D-glucosaminate-6-phosphate ammonia-lyase